MDNKKIAQTERYLYGDTLADCVRRLADERLNAFVRYRAVEQGCRVCLKADIPIRVYETPAQAKQAAQRIAPLAMPLTSTPLDALQHVRAMGLDGPANRSTDRAARLR